MTRAKPVLVSASGSSCWVSAGGQSAGDPAPLSPVESMTELGGRGGRGWGSLTAGKEMRERRYNWNCIIGLSA